MIIPKENKPTNRKIEIDLTGPEGNAFVLMSYAKDLAKQIGLNYKEILDEMKSGDYENLIKVFDRYFGEYVILYK